MGIPAGTCIFWNDEKTKAPGIFKIPGAAVHGLVACLGMTLSEGIMRPRFPAGQLAILSA
jgi:hypothetical protein